MEGSNVTFDPSNMYWNNASEKTRIINLVISNAPTRAARATVVDYAPRSDRRQHTVDYYDAAGGRISRDHVV